MDDRFLVIGTSLLRCRQVGGRGTAAAGKAVPPQIVTTGTAKPATGARVRKIEPLLPDRPGFRR